MKHGFLVLVSMVLALPAAAADVNFGTLPDGAKSTNVVSEVHAEICRDHLFDPARIKSRLPDGYRLILANEYAKEDPGAAEFIKANPKIAGYAVGSLCFMSVGSFVADGVQMATSGDTPMAFWWVHAVGPRDPRMLGKVNWLQLASWYSRDIAQTDRVVATDPTAQFADLKVTEVEPGLWRMRLVLPGEVVEGEVRGSGERKKRKAPEPGFMSVPFTGKSADHFWIITYFGHHHRSAQGQWQARSTGAEAGTFTDALHIPGESAVFGTVFQDGWSALSAVYGPPK